MQMKVSDCLFGKIVTMVTGRCDDVGKVPVTLPKRAR